MSSSSQFGVLTTLDGVSPIAGNIALTSTGATITITPGVGTINLESVGGGGGITTINGDSSFVTGAAVTFSAANAGGLFTGNGTTGMDLTFNTLLLPDTASVSTGVVYINSLPFLHAYPGTSATNCFIGHSGNFSLSTASSNLGAGEASLDALTTGDDNIGLGERTLSGLQDGNANIAIGVAALEDSTSGNGNVAIGLDSLAFSLTGSGNIAIGYNSGSAYTGAEAHNILLGSSGVVGESSVMRLGVNVDLGNPTQTFIGGISGNSPGVGDQIVYVNTTTGQMSSSASAGGIVTIDGDSGTATGATITLTGGASGAVFTGDNASTVTMSFNELNLPATTSSSLGVVNIDSLPFMHGYGATADFNTFVGSLAGNFTLTTGAAKKNTGVGKGSAVGLTTGVSNTTIGHASGSSVTTGSNNVALGAESLANLITGIANISIGFQSGSAYTTNESGNICIGAPGVIGDGTTMRLGSSATSTYVGGIYNASPASTSRIAYIDTDGKMSATTGALRSAYTSVSTTPYVVSTTDQFISVDSSGGARTVQLPNAATSGRVWTIKDRTGSAATNNITVTTVGGAVNIDAATTFVMNTAYQSIQVIGNGTTYEIF